MARLPPATPTHTYQTVSFAVLEKMNSREKEKCVSENRKLQKICGVPDHEIEDFADRVRSTYACFKDTLETTLKHDIGANDFDRLVNEAREKFGMKSRNNVLKSAAAMEFVIDAVIQSGKSCSTIQEIYKKIWQIRLDTYSA